VKNNQYINIKRLYLLLRNNLINSRFILIAVVVFFLAALISQRIFWNETQKMSLIIARSGLGLWIIGGCVITSFSFNELFVIKRGYFFLALPASKQEKYFSKLITTTILWILLALIVYLAYIEINAWLIGRPGLPFNPFRSDTWQILQPIKLYIILQSIFFLGSIYFKIHAFLKTLLAIMVIFCFGMFICGLSLWILNSDISHYFYGNIDFELGINLLKNNFAIPALYLIPPFCWMLTYIRFTESEV